MLNLSLAGNLGRDAEHKTTQGGQELCSFAVAVNVGFGENKSTVWVDVTRWGKGAEGLARILRKGSKVYVEGSLRTRKWQDSSGADRYSTEVHVGGIGGVLTMLDGPQQTGERKKGYDEPPENKSAGGFAIDLDDDIPF